MVHPASSVRCNRIALPERFGNASTSPYNPAVGRHPVTGEWILLHTLDEVPRCSAASNFCFMPSERTCPRDTGRLAVALVL